MKFLVLLLGAAYVSAAVVEPRRGGNRKAGSQTTSAAAAATGAATSGASGSTQVFTEIGGVPGNECLTFRNNGEIVDAACVDTAADRQMTPTTLSSGDAALKVQRTFTAGFRPDLVDVDACVGFNGTHFRAEDCTASGIELVTLQNGELVASGGACASGHDDAAQMTVDTQGQSCASYTTTNVTPSTS
ncbi:hypothetical protein PFICI_02209 [Pestalotiopsis fici W106-1]|uniref:Cyanovirin-N domain-containing protein n=1 Tax=Pestalotiopsis fici (strain W106-1 / CGMCC3.15140) TaxID=1229662 RepID=W3XDT3_PESFW|nr:uncharacterized protein PFICI_02209 [Pestalotiopsis fici W106-1]ETS84184.1 hypothetical protein PFICI_02209 [Pestalotiopsis fici W106-1]